VATRQYLQPNELNTTTDWITLDLRSNLRSAVTPRAFVSLKLSWGSHSVTWPLQASGFAIPGCYHVDIPDRVRRQVLRQHCWPLILRVLWSPVLLEARQAFLARRKGSIRGSEVLFLQSFLPTSVPTGHFAVFLHQFRGECSATRQCRQETTSCQYSGH